MFLVTGSTGLGQSNLFSGAKHTQSVKVLKWGVKSCIILPPLKKCMDTKGITC